MILGQGAVSYERGTPVPTTVPPGRLAVCVGCRANLAAHTRLSRPDSGPSFEVKTVEPFDVLPSSLKKRCSTEGFPRREAGGVAEGAEARAPRLAAHCETSVRVESSKEFQRKFKRSSVREGSVRE